ncbi:universal stress protein [Halochromatium salexigens]|uniref:UspA domain-containing protein n=1 Tax=Halochromatium salexigens TaxID=49447 RepID=A0AAJ0XEQ4_HALSE|nr:hypothetical protein [Halochromatium salexigens]
MEIRHEVYWSERQSSGDETISSTLSRLSKGYTHLLVGLDFASESEVVLERALMMRDRFEARLSLVNVVDYVAPGSEYAGDAFVGEPLLPDDGRLERELLEESAQQEIDALDERLSVPVRDRSIDHLPWSHETVVGPSLKRMAIPPRLESALFIVSLDIVSRCPWIPVVVLPWMPLGSAYSRIAAG